jgi:uncharacterized protein (TIGR00661 family)
MAREKVINYGICGEGLGHLARAEFLIPHLIEAGYRVNLHASGRASRVARERLVGEGIEHTTIRGLHFVYRDNQVALAASALRYAGIALWWTGATAPHILSNLRSPPAAIITDYEPVLARTRMAAGVPHIAFDHQQIATIAAPPAALGARSRRLASLRFFNSMIVGRPSLRIVTSFFRPVLLRRWRDDPSLRVVGAILRAQVLERRATRGDHVVVYQTSGTMSWLPELLRRLPGEKRVYGVGSDSGEAGAEMVDGINYRPMSRDGFLDDLASCRFVVTNGGYSVISEAIHFGKPVLSLPILHQTEQELNAAWVEELGFGRRFLLERGDIPDLGGFVERLNEFEERIAAGRLAPGNDAARGAVLEYLDSLERRGAS